MRKVLYGLLTLVTISLIIVTGWTGSINLVVETNRGQTVTDNFQLVDDDPLEGNVTLYSRNEMYESEPIDVVFNISLDIQNRTPMYLKIRSITILLSPLNFENRTEADLPRVVGRWPIIWLQFYNVTSVNLVGAITITPAIIIGDMFLGCSIDYILRNDSSSGLCEYGNDCWFGPDRSLFMIPVNVYPLILKPTGWSAGLVGLLLVWVLVVINEIRRLTKSGWPMASHNAPILQCCIS